MAEELKEKLKNLPNLPGVYLFKDASGKIIYIGKAKSLKKRVNSYFSRQLDAKTQSLVAKIKDLECRIVDSETQAELLEASLIKDLKPQYNIIFKDDKSFPRIKISDEEFPVISICRQKKNLSVDKSLYFGPFTDAVSLRQAFKVIRKVFGFRTCSLMPKKPCLYCRLKLCPAPCAGFISQEEYRALIQQICLFLEGKYEMLIKELGRRMNLLSRENKFEEAAKIRDQIYALSVLTQSKEYPVVSNELEDLQNLLGLERMPMRIEGFDISNISGKEACGSMVSFLNGRPDKNNYRRFKIKYIPGVDDYAMLRQVVLRRYTKVKEENLAKPDLILIDGGKGHLSVAQSVLDGLGLKIPLMSIAKEHEHIYSPGRSEPLKLSSATPALNLIRRVRDEAHRFAVAYHHLLRRKKIIGK